MLQCFGCNHINESVFLWLNDTDVIFLMIYFVIHLYTKQACSYFSEKCDFSSALKPPGADEL